MILQQEQHRSKSEGSKENDGGAASGAEVSLSLWLKDK